MDQAYFMYGPMDEAAFIRYVLDYTMERAIETFRRIPEDGLCGRPQAALNPPAWIFGHIAVTERKHVGYFLEGVDDIPARYHLFHTGARWAEDEVRKAFDTKDELIGYWREVREKTVRYLQSIRDEDLRRPPESEFIDQAGPNRENPMREWFVMTIQHQNYHWGQLAAIEALLRRGG